MSTDRRTLLVVLVALAVAAPAAALRALCVGRSCRATEPAAGPVPFCSLPGHVRDLLVAGFRDGRGPHLMAVAGPTPIRGSSGEGDPFAPWPSVDPGTSDRVPLVFAGAGVRPEAVVPSGTTLDAMAPTAAQAIGLRRPHPGVRSGRPLPGVARPASQPRLVLQVVWAGVGTTTLRADPATWPTLRGLIEDHPATLDARVGSLPLDPAAVLTTIGTGALPRDHGITGTLVRDDEGRTVRAWGARSPYSVVAGLGDDLDELRDQRPRIGAVVTSVAERGVIGGGWYVDGDRDDVVVEPSPARQADAAAGLLADGYGRDEVPDLLAVVMRGSVRALDRALAEVLVAAEDAVGRRVLYMVTATGQGAGGGGIPASDVEAQVERRVGYEVVEAAGPGGLFLDQQALAAEGLSDDSVLAALRGLRGPNGEPAIVDAFPQVAVTFARYC
jgi:hypothetical protein